MHFDGELIRSRQNQNVVRLCKLSDRKEREATRTFRFDGIKLLVEALANGIELSMVFLRASDADRILSVLQKNTEKKIFDNSVKVLLLADDVFDRVSEEKSPEGVITIAKYIDKFQKIVTIYNSADLFAMQRERIVMLESIRDPANVGAIIRSAAAMGIDRLILSADCADIYHPRAVRASMGTLFNQPIDRTEDLRGVIGQFCMEGRRVFAAALDARAMPLGSFDFALGDCVVIGNEGHGLSEQTVAACSGSVIIPMSGRAESFNAAVAASILMWELARKRDS